MSPSLIRERYVFYWGEEGWAGSFECIVFSKVLTLSLGQAKEKHDPSQKITRKCVILPVSPKPDLVTSDQLLTYSYALSQHRGKTLNFT